MKILNCPVLGFYVSAMFGLGVVFMSSTYAMPTPKTSSLKLEAVASGFNQITDIQFVPGSSQGAVVLEKGGAVWMLDFKTRDRTKLLDLKVPTESELGLLGFAFHPNFSQTRRVFLNYNPSATLSRISEWLWPEAKTQGKAPTLSNERVILEVEQPYKNHNGGSLVFGPDGFLYIGFGDGGFRGDPENRAQNLTTLLGKMLRIDVDKRDTGLSYSIPKDNPYVKSSITKESPRREIFAYGLRNPWKYSFDSKGRLVAGDVGQNAYEEITFVPKGGNLGWRVLEASHCYEPKDNCKSKLKKSIPPIAEYGRELGASVTGGLQYNGERLKDLKNRYVFGDFVSGRIWSIDLPSKQNMTTANSETFTEHGKFEIAISTFARDPNGELYVADFSGGNIYRLAP